METKNIRVIKENGELADFSLSLLESEKEAKIKITLKEDAVIREVIIFDELIDCPENYEYYGEAYQMITSYIGTSENPEIQGFNECLLLGVPEAEGFFTAYNYMIIKSTDEFLLYGATSCNSYNTQIRFNKNHIVVAQDFENKFYSKGNDIHLEGFAVLRNEDINKLTDEYAFLIERNHKRKIYKENPVGWCSWYTYEENLSDTVITDTVNCIKKDVPYLKYIQIGDGYQPHMGDWLLTTDKFSKPMKDVCLEIKKEGFEPAIWVAPFIASQNSEVFKNHPDWFIFDDNHKPLSGRDAIGNSGWRDIVWYCLDPTNPEALEYIVNVCKTMKYEWGVNYFKFDANVWGALFFGHRYDDRLTSVEAYRLGMSAIWDAVGDDTYILGCNAPFWPSLGLVTGMRVSTNAMKNYKSILGCAKQTFRRNWMNNRLWLNDPDCIISDNNESIGENLIKMQNIYVAASGGSRFYSGDPENTTPKIRSFLERLSKQKYTAARFNFELTEGIAETEEYTDYFYFNYSQSEQSFRTTKTAFDMYSNVMAFPDYRITLEPMSAQWLRIKK